jgi:exosortase
VQLLLVPLSLLALAIPIPAIIFNKVAFPLQLFASRCAVWSMSLFDIPVLRQGNVIELLPLGARETRKLEVVEACSGIRSLMTLVTLAVVFAYFTHPRSDGSSGGRRRESSSG